MILVDTSAAYALADANDENHAMALTLLQAAVAKGEPILIHSYAVLEAASLMQRRLGLAPALSFLRSLDQFTLHWIDSKDHEEAVQLLEARNRRGLSLVDCASFVVMRRYGLTQGLFFDADFEREGFEIYAE